MFTAYLRVVSIKVQGRTCYNFPKWRSMTSTDLHLFVQKFHKMIGKMN